jgi:Damage-control phosphatase ARMT1-like domain
MDQPLMAANPLGVDHHLPLGNPILGNRPGSFTHTVLARRHPALIDQVRAAHPYGPRQRSRLDALHEEITAGPITPLPAGADDRDRWQTWGAPYVGRSWFEVPFLWAESYFYRRLLQAVDYFTAGPWAGLDPFEPAKSAELATVTAVAHPEGRQELLRACLWGNQADLGFRAGAAGSRRPDRSEPLGPLVVDHTDRLWNLLDQQQPGRVILIADNAGRELLADLLLIDHLLATRAAQEVILHLKPAPYFVSDATTADLSGCLRVLARTGPGWDPRTVAAARRLRAAAATGALVIAAHPFFCAPLPFHDLPADLVAEYAAAQLVLVKGDLNYRRLVGDTDQPASTAFEDATGYFPAPVAALRTLKSDVVVGLDSAALGALDATGLPWRTDGTHALIQVCC